jgi:hypothetical protein
MIYCHQILDFHRSFAQTDRHYREWLKNFFRRGYAYSVHHKAHTLASINQGEKPFVHRDSLPTLLQEDMFEVARITLALGASSSEESHIYLT